MTIEQNKKGDKYYICYFLKVTICQEMCVASF